MEPTKAEGNLKGSMERLGGSGSGKIGNFLTFLFFEDGPFWDLQDSIQDSFRIKL